MHTKWGEQVECCRSTSAVMTVRIFVACVSSLRAVDAQRKLELVRRQRKAAVSQKDEQNKKSLSEKQADSIEYMSIRDLKYALNSRGEVHSLIF